MFHFVVSSSKNRNWHIAFFVLSFSCSTYSKLCKSRYVKRNQNCNLHIIFFINKIKDFYIYTTERTKEVPNKRSKAGEKKNQNFLLWESYQCPDPIQPGTTRATSTTTPRQRVWRRRSGLHSFVNKTGNRIIHAELCLAAQVRTASVHE